MSPILPARLWPTVVALACCVLAAIPAVAEAYQVTVHVHGAGKVTETTSAALMNCTVPMAGRAEWTLTDCVAGSPSGGYGIGWVVELEASVPAAHFARGWRFQKWVDSASGFGTVDCDPGGVGGNHTSTTCRFQIFEDLEVDLYFEDVAGPQDTTIASGPADPTNAKAATFTFGSEDPDAGYECKLEGFGAAGTWYPCGSPSEKAEAVVVPDDGAYTFSVRGADPTGNVDPTPATWTWTVDTIAPSAWITGSPAPGAVTSSTSAAFSASASEPGVLVCTFDGVPSACATARTGLPDGVHTFAARATDLAGNTGAPTVRTWTVDTVAPETSVTAGPADGSQTTATGAEFAFGSPDGTASFECALDGAAFAPCTSPKAYTGLALGAHSFRVRARDVAGNVDPTPAIRSWTVTTLGSSTPTPTPAPPPPPPPPPPPAVLATAPVLAGGPAPASPGTTGADRHPAKLKVRRAGVRNGRLDVLAEMTNHANGDEVTITFEAGGERHTFTETVENGRLRFTRTLPRSQRRVRSGIVTYRYAGSDTVRPAEVRLRAANGKAGLKREKLSLRDGTLTVEGTISRRARGVVRFELSYALGDGSVAVWTGRAPIERGRWRLSEKLPAEARDGGYLTIQFTGYGPRDMRGEQDAKLVAP